MKKQFHLLTGLLLMAFLLSCKKPVVAPNPGPNPNPQPVSHSVQWTMDSIPGETPAAASRLFALVTLENSQNEEVVTNRRLALTYNGKFETAASILPAGTLKLTRFLIVGADNKVRFISPITPSPKASLVNRPLPISVTLPQPALVKVAVDVLGIRVGDTPASFGYPAGTFDPITQNPPQEPDNFYVGIRPMVRVGDILYDSIPATVVYTSWNENMQPSTQSLTMAPGTNSLLILSSAVKHHFRYTKWGATTELTLMKSDMKKDSVYKLEASIASRKLKQQYGYRLQGSSYVAISKTEFHYNSNGKISDIEYFLRRADYSPYLAAKDQFTYAGTQLQSIQNLGETGSILSETQFFWNGAGKINKIVENKGGIRTQALVSYTSNNSTGISETIMDYSFSNTGNGKHYYQHFQNGNRFSDNSNTDNGNIEMGDYQYDLQINPYAQMGWYDLTLSHGSRNNLISQAKTFQNAWPEAVAYSFSYTYDALGYPTELICQFKSPVTGQYLYTAKTVYVYY